MAYVVDRVVICDAYDEPTQHYTLLQGGRSRLTTGRRPSMWYTASGRSARGGISGIVGKQASLFEDMLVSNEQQNTFVNELRTELRGWRAARYPGTAVVTRRLLEWWFASGEERASLGQRLFFCQQEAIEAVIFLYEVKHRQKMPETGDLLRYALKLATGTGKTLVMALTITWSTLHKRKVSNSSLSANFLILTPNLTVRDRVSGMPRGDGLDPTGEYNLYDAFNLVPPEYREEFQPNILVKNWQAIPLEIERSDWVSRDVAADGRFVPAAVLLAMHRRARQDPAAAMRRLLGGWRDLVIINDEAHHVYGEKRTRRGEDPDYIKWSRIIERVNAAANISLVVDLSATPWYGSGSPKPEGTLFEWMVSDFSVYDAFESGLVKVVRLPEQDGSGAQYLDLWDQVKGARTKEEYLSACKGAIASIYSAWSKAFQEWNQTFEILRVTPAPVLLVVADRAERARWLFEHLTQDYELLRNPDDDDPLTWHTIRIDSKVFDAEKGNEAVLREIVNTVGRSGKPGADVRCIVSVNMLSEGWDVKSVTHILGLRAFGSPLLTEQVVGRGLRRANYDLLNLPLEQRGPDTEETVDAFGIPFIGFPVERRRRPRTGRWGKPMWIQKVNSKRRFRMRIPNVRSWGVGVSRSLVDAVCLRDLPDLLISPRETPTNISVRPVVGGHPGAVMTLDEFRREYPLLRTEFLVARELLDRTNPETADDLGIGPMFDELLELSQAYLGTRVRTLDTSQIEDVGIYYWRQRVLDILETAIRGAEGIGIGAVPILSSPAYLDTEDLRRFQWTGITYEGKKCHFDRVPCHTDLEQDFAAFLDEAPDVERYVKNERLGFSITYFDHNRPRQYYPDFVVDVRTSDGQHVRWIAETKGEMRPNTEVKGEAATLWCRNLSGTSFGTWRYLFVPEQSLRRALESGAADFSTLAGMLASIEVRQAQNTPS